MERACASYGTDCKTVARDSQRRCFTIPSSGTYNILVLLLKAIQEGLDFLGMLYQSDGVRRNGVHHTQVRGKTLTKTEEKETYMEQTNKKYVPSAALQFAASVIKP